MKRYIFIFGTTVLFITMIGCAAAPPPSDAVYARQYRHRVVRVVPVTRGNTITVKVHHVGTLTKAERNDLIRWYKHKHYRPNQRVKVILIRS